MDKKQKTKADPRLRREDTGAKAGPRIFANASFLRIKSEDDKTGKGSGQARMTGNPKIAALQKKLQEIEEVTIPKIISRRTEAAGWGDLSENAAYEQANADLQIYQSMMRDLKAEIKKLEGKGS